VTFGRQRNVGMGVAWNGTTSAGRCLDIPRL
jgi:hypothetical protein